MSWFTELAKKLAPAAKDVAKDAAKDAATTIAAEELADAGRKGIDKVVDIAKKRKKKKWKFF